MSDGGEGALVQRPRELSVRTGALVGPAAGALSTARLSFGGELVRWEDLPRATQRAARRSTAALAEAAHVGREVESEAGVAVQRVRAWRAHTDAVVLAWASRPVRPALGGGYAPAGPWRDRGTQHVAVAGAPRARRGLVAVADELSERVGGRGSLDHPLPADQREAAEAWTYLPAVVRAAAEAAVKEPLLWLGDLVQENSSDGFPTSQQITSLRLDAQRAIVIHATRALLPLPGANAGHERARMAARPWLVEQIGYDLPMAERLEIRSR